MNSILVNRGLPPKMTRQTETDGVREKAVTTPRWNVAKTSSGRTLDQDQSNKNDQGNEAGTCCVLTQKTPEPISNIMDGAGEESVHLELDINKKPIHNTRYIQEDMHYFQLKAAQAKKSIEFIELLTAMSPGTSNTVDLQKLTELQVTNTKGHTMGNRTNHCCSLRGKNRLTLNCTQYPVPGSNSNLLNIKHQLLKMRKQDMKLRQQIEIKEAEAHAEFKENILDSPKTQSFSKSVIKKKKERKELRPLSVPKALNSANKQVQIQKFVSTELPALTKNNLNDYMKMSIPKTIGTKKEKMKISENSKPSVKSHLNVPYLNNCSIITRSSEAMTKSVLEKMDHSSDEKYISITQLVKKAKKFFPPISQEHHKIEKQDKVKTKSKELKLPDIYAPTKDVLKSWPHKKGPI